MCETIRVIIADDHEFFRNGLKQMLHTVPGLHIVGETDNGIDLVKLCETLQPDLVITDIAMEGHSGLVATKMITEKNDAIKVLALSVYDDDHSIFNMLTAGARGYLSKTVKKGDVLDAIEVLFNSNRYFLGTKSRRLIALFKNYRYPDLPRNPVKFTEKEMQVLYLLIKEYKTSEIAAELCLSPKTVSEYRAVLMAKTNSKNTIGVVSYALRNRMFF